MYKMKYIRKRSTRPRRRYAVGKPLAYKRGKVPRGVREPVITLSRTFWYETWTPNTISTAGFWKYYSFQMIQLPSNGEFTGPFDRYKINAIKVTFRPRYDGFSGNDTTDTTLPGITNQGTTMAHVVNDPTSNVTPGGTYTSATLNNFLENGRAKTYMGTKPFSVFFKPMINQTVGGVAAGRRIKAPYLQTSTALSVDHNGFHVFLQDVNLTGVFNQGFDVFVTYYFSCKGVK